MQLKQVLSTFTDTDGTPLSDGYLYFGQRGLDVIANPLPVYWDETQSVLAAQPIRTRGGYPVDPSGDVGALYGSEFYTIRVSDRRGHIVREVDCDLTGSEQKLAFDTASDFFASDQDFPSQTVIATRDGCAWKIVALLADADFTHPVTGQYLLVVPTYGPQMPTVPLTAFNIESGSAVNQQVQLQIAINTAIKRQLELVGNGSIRADRIYFAYHPTHNPNGLDDKALQGYWAITGGIRLAQTGAYQGREVGLYIYSELTSGSPFVYENPDDLDLQKFVARGPRMTNVTFAGATQDDFVLKINHVSEPVLSGITIVANHKDGSGLQMRGCDQWNMTNIAIIGDPVDYATGTGKGLELDQNSGSYTSTSGDGPADASRAFWDGCMIRGFSDAGHIGGTTIGEKQIAMSTFRAFGTNNVSRSLTFGGVMWSCIFDGFQLRGDIRGAQLRGKLIGNVWDALNCAAFEQTGDDDSAPLLVGHIDDVVADRAFFNNVVRNFYCAEQGAGMPAVKWSGAVGYEGIHFERPAVFMRTAADIFAHFLSAPTGGGWSDLALHGAATYSMSNVYSGSIPFGDVRLTAFSDHAGNGYRDKNSVYGAGSTVAATSTTNLNFGPYHNITGTGSINILRFVSGTQKIMHGTEITLRFAGVATLKGLGGTGNGNLDIGADYTTTAGEIVRLVYDINAASAAGGWYFSA